MCKVYRTRQLLYPSPAHQSFVERRDPLFVSLRDAHTRAVGWLRGQFEAENPGLMHIHAIFLFIRAELLILSF